jgi:hypothetical protein
MFSRNKLASLCEIRKKRIRGVKRVVEYVILKPKYSFVRTKYYNPKVIHTVPR